MSEQFEATKVDRRNFLKGAAKAVAGATLGAVALERSGEAQTAPAKDPTFRSQKEREEFIRGNIEDEFKLLNPYQILAKLASAKEDLSSLEYEVVGRKLEIKIIKELLKRKMDAFKRQTKPVQPS